MFTHKDVEYKTIFVINCIQKRSIRVVNGELLLEEYIEDSDKTKTLTKLPFQKILALFIIGHIRITTPLIEKCHKYGIALVVLKLSFRPVFYWANFAEANFLLHKKQYEFSKDDISIAKVLVTNKIVNQIQVLKDTRCKDNLTLDTIKYLNDMLLNISNISEYESLMGIEGLSAKLYFKVYYKDFNWGQRKPRTKCDPLNTTLDIGYTMLFNYLECFLRMFGFDIYVGVYHRMWYKRKSLVCDIVEPFRPIIDKAIRIAWNRNQFSNSDFTLIKGEYRLKYEKNYDYCSVFFNALIPYKKEIFKYIQSYYKCFMGKKSILCYPLFKI